MKSTFVRTVSPSMKSAPCSTASVTTFQPQTLTFSSMTSQLATQRVCACGYAALPKAVEMANAQPHQGDGLAVVFGCLLRQLAYKSHLRSYQH